MENWLAAAAAGVLAVFGGTSTSDHRPERPIEGRPTTTQQRNLQNVDIQCVAAAVAAREASLGIGEQTLTAGINSAFSTRKSALASAYALTGQTAIKDAVKAAWKQFADSTKGARSAWKISKESAWQTFKTAIRSCGTGAAAVADTLGAGSELNL